AMNRSTDVQRFGKMMAVLQAVFDKVLRPEAQDACFSVLEDLPIEAVERAGELALKSCKFFPKPAELRELAEGSFEDRSQLALSSLDKIAARFGDWCSLYTEDAATAQAIVDTFGSWLLCAEFLHT